MSFLISKFQILGDMSCRAITMAEEMLGLGNTCYVQEELNLALEYYNRGIFFVDEASEKVAKELHLNRARVFKELGSFEMAMSDIDWLINAGWDVFDVHQMRVEVLYLMGNYGMALRVLETMKPLDESSKMLHSIWRIKCEELHASGPVL